MIVINKKSIKNKRNLNIFLKSIDKIDSVENINYLNKLYNINLNDKNLLIMLSLLKDYGKKVIKYVDKVDDFYFSKPNFIEYYNFITDNPKCNSVPKIWKIIYGEEETVKRLNKLRVNSLTPFNLEYWVSKGFSEKESLIKTDEYRIKCGNKKEHYILRYGEVDGLQKFKEFGEKSKHTLTTFIKKYGEVYGEIKYNEYLKTKDSNSPEWAIKKAKGNIELADKILKERKKSTIITLDKLIKKYGDIELAKKKLNDINKNKDASSLNYFLKKCNGNKKEAKKLYQEHSIKKDCMSINHFLKKTNGDLELAKVLQIEELKRRSVSFFIASKESLKYFIPLYKFLRKNGIERNDIFLGVNGSYEYRLHNLVKNITFSYDFTLPNLKIIIEYHGEKFHPNVEKYGLEKLKEDNWGKYFKLNLEESIKKDNAKKELALKNGFEYLELWSSDREEINKNKINNLIKQKIK